MTSTDSDSQTGNCQVGASADSLRTLRGVELLRLLDELFEASGRGLPPVTSIAVCSPAGEPARQNAEAISP